MKKAHILKKLFFFLLLTTGGVALSVRAQSNVLISHLNQNTRIGFDLNYLWNYNQYEHSRWGGEFNISTPFRADTAKVFSEQRRLFADIYVGIGSLDHAFKYGSKWQLVRPHRFFDILEIQYKHDLERVGAHSFGTYNLFGTYNNSGYVTNRYTAFDRICLGGRHPGSANTFYAEIRLSKERNLFNDTALLYPSLSELDAQSPNYADANKIGEFHLCDVWNRYWTFDLLLGVQSHNDPFYRLLIQYNRLFAYSNTATLDLFAQAGTASATAPASRTFDLSGTAFGYYYFNHTFLTIRPNTLMAHTFAHICLSYHTPALWNRTFSKPTVLLQMNAIWGCASQSAYTDAAGQYHTACYGQDRYQVDLITADAPVLGLLEPAMGIDGLLNWGILSFGFAAAYQLSPTSTHYHSTTFKDCFALVGIATLTLATN